MVSPENSTSLKSEIRSREAIGKDFNLWVHDFCSHEMDFIDLDGVMFKKSRKLLRLFEAKHLGEPLKSSQTRIFPILSGMLSYASGIGLLDADSGLFVIRGNPPYDEGAEVYDWSASSKIALSRRQLVAFVDGEDLQIAARLFPEGG